MMFPQLRAATGQEGCWEAQGMVSPPHPQYYLSPATPHRPRLRGQTGWDAAVGRTLTCATPQVVAPAPTHSSARCQHWPRSVHPSPDSCRRLRPVVCEAMTAAPGPSVMGNPASRLAEVATRWQSALREVCWAYEAILAHATRHALCCRASMVCPCQRLHSAPLAQG